MGPEHEQGIGEGRKLAYKQAKEELTDYQLKYLNKGLTEELASTILRAVEAERENGRPVADILGEEYHRNVPLLMLGGGTHRTAQSLAMILRDGDPDSGYVLARTLVERTINFAFLAICEDSHFQDWLDYSQQKAFRLTQVEKNAGSYGISIGRNPPADPTQIPGLEQNLHRFTGKSGQERTRWTDLRLDDRLGSIDGKLDGSKNVIVNLLGALASTYDLGAEVQHGTLVGVQAGFGMAGMGRNVQEQLDTIGLSLCLCLDAAIHVLAHISMAPDWANEPNERLLALLRLSRGGAASDKKRR